ncbi:Shikimate kinase 2 [Rubripirellula lacrimiformis]|uniref:Shikimate kinase n=1 Tax=Rubripirellula lacrimiformis TaxID=1930273 RepID=A0A517NHB2_9BACT|nr:shikimate kinase [Rubripirellula lacrimiformis]QDT06512.1 Shikimate kinase 2 [Rubripirellula lacrimiformis]
MKTSAHIYLTGFRGTGKTSVAARLAAAWAMEKIDLDDVIEAAAGKSIRQIFAVGGESHFRDLETEALRLVAAGPKSIISLGGGAILRPENRTLIASTGQCIWLDATADEICNRVLADASTAERRPALTALSQREEITRLLAEREDLYRASSDYHVDTSGKSIDEVASEIVKIWQS